MEERPILAPPPMGAGLTNELIPLHKLQKYLQLFASSEKIDSSVISTLADLGNELVVSVIEEACQLATLKESRLLEPRDIRFVAESLYDINLPSTLSVFNGNSDSMDSLLSSTTSSIASGTLISRDDAHLRRMAQIRQNVLASAGNSEEQRK